MTMRMMLGVVPANNNSFQDTHPAPMPVTSSWEKDLPLKPSFTDLGPSYSRSGYKELNKSNMSLNTSYQAIDTSGQNDARMIYNTHYNGLQVCGSLCTFEFKLYFY